MGGCQSAGWDRTEPVLGAGGGLCLRVSRRVRGGAWARLQGRGRRRGWRWGLGGPSWGGFCWDCVSQRPLRQPVTLAEGGEDGIRRDGELLLGGWGGWRILPLGSCSRVPLLLSPLPRGRCGRCQSCLAGWHRGCALQSPGADGLTPVSAPQGTTALHWGCCCSKAALGRAGQAPGRRSQVGFQCSHWLGPAAHLVPPWPGGTLGPAPHPPGSPSLRHLLGPASL